MEQNPNYNSMSNTLINIDYLCNGVYTDCLSKIKINSLNKNSYKTKMLSNSNGIQNIINDSKYKNIVQFK